RRVKRKLQKNPGFPRFFWTSRAALKTSMSKERDEKFLRELSRQPCYAFLGPANKRRMSDLQQQLADLRARVARINSKYDSKYDSGFPSHAGHFSAKFSTSDLNAESAEIPAEQAQSAVEGWLGGEQIETEYGRHFETEKLYERYRRHGSADIGSLADLPHDLLDAISGGASPLAPPAEWAFLDTE